MSEKKKKAARRAQRELNGVAQNPGYFETVPVIKGDDLPAFFQTRFIGKSGYNYLAIPAYGSVYKTDGIQCLVPVELHKTRPVFDKKSGRYAYGTRRDSDGLVRVQEGFPGLLYTKKGELFKGEEINPTTDYSFIGEIANATPEELDLAIDEDQKIAQEANRSHEMIQIFTRNGCHKDIQVRYFHRQRNRILAEGGYFPNPESPDCFIKANGTPVENEIVAKYITEMYPLEIAMTSVKYYLTYLFRMLQKLVELEGTIVSEDSTWKHASLLDAEVFYARLLKHIPKTEYIVAPNEITFTKAGSDKPLNPDDTLQVILRYTEKYHKTFVTLLEYRTSQVDWYKGVINKSPDIYEDPSEGVLKFYDGVADFDTRDGIVSFYRKDGKRISLKEFMADSYSLMNKMTALGEDAMIETSVPAEEGSVAPTDQA